MSSHQNVHVHVQMYFCCRCYVGKVQSKVIPVNKRYPIVLLLLLLHVDIYTCASIASGRACGKLEMMKPEVQSRRCHVVLRLSCLWVSERITSLGCWHTSCLLSPLSCCLSSFYWVVNCLPYLWTRSGIDFCSSSLQPPLHAIASWAPHAEKVHKLCVNPYISIVTP